MKALPACSIIENATLRCVQTSSLSPGAQVLDAPCGGGALAVTLKNAGWDTWGADLECEAQGWSEERFRRADLDAVLLWPDASFDLVLSVEGVEHLENRFTFFREVYRVLKPCGPFIIAPPNIVSLRSRGRFMRSGFYHKDPRPLLESKRHPLHHIGLCTFPQLSYDLPTSGFRLVRVGHTHTKLVSYLYAFYIPWMWFYTLITFRKGKDAAQRKCNREIRRTLFFYSLLFGENPLLMARKQ